MKIYLAGPISGLSYNEVYKRLQAQKLYLELWNYKVLSPLVGKRHLVAEKELRATGYADNPISNGHSIYHRDKWMVTKQADVLLADFTDATEVSIGTCMEVAWAAQVGIHVVVVLPADNVHQHAFILEAADVVFPNRDDAVNYLVDIISGVES